MRLFHLAAPAILLAFAMSVSAQFNGAPRYDPDSVSALVDKVHADLDRGYGVWRGGWVLRDRTWGCR